MNKLSVVLIGIVSMVALSGCELGLEAQGSKNTAADKGESLAKSLSFEENAEQDNIVKRLELTSNPGLTGYITLFNEMGRPILYAGVKGKITSGGKRYPQNADDSGTEGAT